MVLGGGQQHHALAVAEGKHRHLRPLGALLQHQAGASAAEATRKNLLNGGAGLRQAVCHRHPLAGRQAIGLHHQGASLGFKQGQGFVPAAGRPVAGGGDGGGHHQGLGPLLTGFQLGPIGAGAKHGQAGGPKPVGQAGGQGRLRAHHHQVDGVGSAGRQQAIGVGFGDRQLVASSDVGRAAIARGYPHRGHALAAGQGPGQGIFAAAAPHHQHALGAQQGRRVGHGSRIKGWGRGRPPLG